MVYVWYYTKAHFKANRDIHHFPKCPLSETEFKKNYRRLPISYPENWTDEQIFRDLNFPGHQMTKPEMQTWLRANGVGHTSMSISDIVERRYTFNIVMVEGFKKCKMGVVPW